MVGTCARSLSVENQSGVRNPSDVSRSQTLFGDAGSKLPRSQTPFGNAGRETLLPRSQTPFGNAGRETLFRVKSPTGNRVSRQYVPKQNLGTRRRTRRIGARKAREARRQGVLIGQDLLVLGNGEVHRFGCLEDPLR